MRLLRLALAIIILVDAWRGETWWLMIFGAILAWQAVMNVGCTACNTGSCTTTPNHSQDEYEIDYEEVK